MAVTAQRGPQRVVRRRSVRQNRGPVREQPGQVTGHFAARGLRHHLSRRVADALQRLQCTRPRPPLELARRQAVEHLRGPAEGLRPVGRRPGPLQLERDLPQRLEWIHVASPTQARAELSRAGRDARDTRGPRRLGDVIEVGGSRLRALLIMLALHSRPGGKAGGEVEAAAHAARCL